MLIISALNPFSELLPNLYYSPIKKLENIVFLKIVRQKRPVTKVGQKLSYSTLSNEIIWTGVNIVFIYMAKLYLYKKF